MNGKKYVDLDAALEAEKAETKSRWDLVIDYFLPGHGNAYGDRTLQDHEWDVFDRTGVDALRDFGAGIYSHTVNINSPWFTLRMNDPELDESPQVKDALTNAAKALYRKLQNSNLEQALTQLFTFFGAFGTGVLYVDVVDGKFRFNNYSPTCVNLTEDEHGMVNKVMRTFQETAVNAYARWGDGCSQEIVEAATSKESTQKNRKFQFLHVVCKRDDNERDAEAKNKENKEWASYYIEKQKGHIVEEGGYDSLPYMTPRFYRHDESVWGQSPAIAHTDTMAMLCKIRYDIAEHAEATLFPPVFTDDQEAVDNNLLSMRPRAINYYKSKDGTPPFALSQGRLAETLQFYQDTVQKVRNAFFADLFLHQMDDDPNRTATEVMERKTERGIRIAPVIVNVETELFGPLVMRCLSLAVEHGFVDEFPEVLQGQEYEVSYTNRLASMLSRSEMQGAMQAIEECARSSELFQTFPLLSEKLNPDEVIDSIMESYNVDTDFTRDPKETEQIRQAKQAEMQRQEQAALQANAVDKIKPNEPIQEGSPLAELQEATG